MLSPKGPKGPKAIRKFCPQGKVDIDYIHWRALAGPLVEKMMHASGGYRMKLIKFLFQIKKQRWLVTQCFNLITSVYFNIGTVQMVKCLVFT